MSLRKSSSRRNGSKSDVLPNPKARRKWTPAPSKVGLDEAIRLMGRKDILTSCCGVYLVSRCSATRSGEGSILACPSPVVEFDPELLSAIAPGNQQCFAGDP